MRNLKSNIKKHSRILIHFSGNILDSYLIKKILEETNNEVIVYYYSYSALDKDMNNLLRELNSSLEILIEFKKNIRDFKVIEIKYNDIFDSIDSENLFLKQILYIDKISDIISDYDLFISPITKDQINDGFNKELIFQKINSTYLDKIKMPFVNSYLHEIINESLSGFLNNEEINYNKVFNNYQNIIKILLDSDYNSKKKELTSKLNKINTALIFRYLLFNNKIFVATRFVKTYGHLIDKKIQIYNLSYNIKCNYNTEEIYVYSVLNSQLNNKDINNILKNYVDNIVKYQSIDISQKVDEVSYFFNIFYNKITEETLDYLAWCCIKWNNYNHKKLLDLLGEYGCDIGEALISSINYFNETEAEDKVFFLIKNYKSHISQLQFDEALIRANSLNFSKICLILIDNGANSKKIKFHNQCYGRNLWIKEIEHNKFRHYWRSKDKVIISHILKELGDPHKKIKNIIHVTGSNGKGSVSSFLKSILKENGYKVNMFTSPSVIRDNENIIVNSKEVTDETYYKYLNKVTKAYNKIKDNEEFNNEIVKANIEDQLTKKQIEEDGLLQWSFTIPMFILLFLENKSDVNIIEVITGGEHDLTNLFNENNTIATIINTIIFGDNHVGEKGFENIESVAYTKSRLSKNNVPIITSKQKSNVLNIIKEVARDRKSQLLIEDESWRIDKQEKFFVYKGFDKEIKIRYPNLIGHYQISNASIALTSLIKLNFKLDYNKTSYAIENTTNKGRFCLLEEKTKNNINELKNYKNVYFGSLKTSFAVIDFLSNKDLDLNKLDIIFVPFINNSYKFSIEYLLNEKFNRVKNKVFIKNNNYHELDSNYSDLLKNIIETNENIYVKTSISSAIRYLHNKNSEHGRNLAIFATGMQDFDGKLIRLFEEDKSENFDIDTKFAKKHKLINEDNIFILNKYKKFDYINFISEKRHNLFEKMYIIAAKNLGLEVDITDNKVCFKKENKMLYLDNADFCELIPKYQRKVLDSKDLSNQIAKNYFLVPNYRICYNQNIKNIDKVINTFSNSFIIKPDKGIASQNIIHVNNFNHDNSNEIINRVRKINDDIIIQDYIQGKEFRIFFVGNKLIYATNKCDPILKGDGKSSIKELIVKHNSSIKVNLDSDYPEILAPRIEFNDDLHNFLLFKGYSLENILDKNKILELNFGGLDRIFIKDNLDKVPNHLKDNIKKFLEHLNATFGCIDFIIKDDDWFFLECNSYPSNKQFIKRNDILEIDTQLPEVILKEIFNYKNNKGYNDKNYNTLKYYDKRYILNGYNLDKYGIDEYNFISENINKSFARKDKINILDFACGDGRMLRIINDYHKNDKGRIVNYYGCDISKFALVKLKEYLVKLEYEELLIDSNKESFISKEQNVTVTLISNNQDMSYQELQNSLPSFDLVIASGFINHIFGQKNRIEFYKFCNSISKKSIHIISANDFEYYRIEYDRLRKKRLDLISSTNTKDKIKQLKEIEDLIGDAKENNEFYHKAGDVRGYSLISPEESEHKVPFVSFPNENELYNEIKDSNPNKIIINKGKGFCGYIDWHFVEVY